MDRRPTPHLLLVILQKRNSPEKCFVSARRAFVTVQFGGAYIEKLILTTKQRLANGFPTIVDGKVHLEPTEFQMGRMMVYTKR
uniref:Uncharacterized protein n=1 Tax=Caenorhabditis japonica TaxID=281687 RepID=A0A8R1ENJ0_CAEJA